MVDEDLLISIATDFYENNLSGIEIADKYGISRATVSNLLKRCRKEGIVDIRINKKPSLTFSLEKELRASLGLNQVYVCATEDETIRTRIAVGQKAADVLAAELRDGLRIGIGFGSSLHETVMQLSVDKNYERIDIVQMLGALGSRDAQLDGFELARTLAHKLNGTYRIIQAPLIVSTAQSRDVLMNEPRIAEVLQMAKDVDIALLGISSNRPEVSGLVRAGFITPEESAALYAEGAVGNVCGLHIDASGNVLPIPLNRRTIGVAGDDLLHIPLKIGIAFGKVKADAIAGAVRARLIDALVTDSDAALGIMGKA
jgi:deoxyribonucleoside regulator